MDISSSFQTALDAVVAFVPRALAFLAILLVGWIVAKLLRKGVTKLLAKVGLDRASEKGGLRRFTGKYTASELCGLVVYAFVLLLTLQLAFGAFGQNPVSSLIEEIVLFLPSLFVALVIMVVAFAIGNVVFELVAGTLSQTSYGRPMGRVAQVFIIAIAAIAALNQVGIATAVTVPILWTALAMVAGVTIVGVGGGLIGPMRSRWERMLGAAENEMDNLKGGTSGEDIAQPSYTGQHAAMDVQQAQEQRTQQQPPTAAG